MRTAMMAMTTRSSMRVKPRARPTGTLALALAERLEHPFSLAIALSFAAMLHQGLGQAHQAAEQAEAAVALCREHEFALFLAVSTVLKGWALAERGRVSEGRGHLREGLAAYRATGAELSRPYFLALLAEACAMAGRADEGLAALAEALTLVSSTGEHWYEAELYRLKGEILLAAQPGRKTRAGMGVRVSEAEACFRQAIAIARRQEARSLELRAVTSWMRLALSQGRDEVRERAAELHRSSADGVATPDLEAARALLEEPRRR